MLESLSLFTRVIWTPLLLYVDLPELLLTSAALPQQPRNKQFCAKTLDFSHLQRTGYAAWEKSRSINVALAAPPGWLALTVDQFRAGHDSTAPSSHPS
jgi:hypothetical protein